MQLYDFFNSKSEYMDKMYRSFQGDWRKSMSPCQNYTENAYWNLTTMTEINPDFRTQGTEISNEWIDCIKNKSNIKQFYDDRNVWVGDEQDHSNKWVEWISRSSNQK